MKKITFGTPEEFVPSKFCSTLNYKETAISYAFSNIQFEVTNRGCRLEIPIDAEEQFYGLGLQLKTMSLARRKFVLKVNADPVNTQGDSHAPVPFFASVFGYGIYFDTARHAEFQFGTTKHNYNEIKNLDNVPRNSVATCTDVLYSTEPVKGIKTLSVEIPVAKGIDIYIFEGKNITEVVSEYNMLSGGGCNVPDWGLGVFYRCYSKYNQDKVLETANYFRNSDIPCSVIGLEPGWQTQTYSCSYVWNKELFPDPEGLAKELLDKGYTLNLWEHAFTHPISPLYDKMSKGCADYEVWNGVIPDFSLPEIRKTFSDYHKEHFTSLGVDGFKLDECDNSDYTGGWSFPDCTKFPSGMDGEQYHSLFGTLYMQTILDSLENKPTYGAVRNAGALASKYPFVLYSDWYQPKDFIRGVVTQGFNGLLWAPEVRHADSKLEMIRRLQTVVFSAQCLVNAWYSEEIPWMKFECEDEVRKLFKLRESLFPMLRKSFNEYEKTGKPPIRALVSDYSGDEETYEIDDQYIFCDNLIVAPMVSWEKERKVYLPEGKWRNYWTKKTVLPGWHTVKTKNIPVYEKVL